MGPFKLRVQAPCAQPWGSMAGDDRSRHCTRCQLRVHNLSAMTADDALKLITGPDERLCVRFNTRGDGTVATGAGEGWFRRGLRVARFAALAIGFWATVVLVQLPWLALARKLSSPPPPAPQPQVDAVRAARAEFERRLAAIEAEMRRERRTMGAISDGERTRIREEATRHQHSTKKR